jgi:hypothetical protein
VAAEVRELIAAAIGDRSGGEINGWETATAQVMRRPDGPNVADLHPSQCHLWVKSTAPTLWSVRRVFLNKRTRWSAIGVSRRGRENIAPGPPRGGQLST